MSNEPVEWQVGEQAPLFSATDANGNIHTLQSYLKNGQSVILYFYPKDSTPGCTTQACDFRDQFQALQTAGYVVLGVSKDSAKSHSNFTSKQSLNFPLLLDEDLTLHHLFGVWRVKKNYGKEYMGCSRSTFVINPNGMIAWARYIVKAKGHVGMLMRELGIGGSE